MTTRSKTPTPTVHRYTVLLDPHCDAGTGLTSEAQSAWAKDAVAHVLDGIAAETDVAVVYETAGGDLVIQSLDAIDLGRILGGLGRRAAYTSLRRGRTHHCDLAEEATRKVVGRRNLAWDRGTVYHDDARRDLSLRTIFGERP